MRLVSLVACPMDEGNMWGLQKGHRKYILSKKYCMNLQKFFATKFIFLTSEQVWQDISIGCLPRCLKWPGPGEARAGSRELSPGLPHMWQGLKYLSHHLVPPRMCISTELELRAELEFKPRHWCGILLPQIVLTAAPNPYSKYVSFN